MRPIVCNLIGTGKKYTCLNIRYGIKVIKSGLSAEEGVIFSLEQEKTTGALPQNESKYEDFVTKLKVKQKYENLVLFRENFYNNFPRIPKKMYDI